MQSPGGYIHPNAIVESKNIGKGTRIWAFAHVLPGARIGKNCNLCDHVFMENDVIVGNNVTIKCGVYIWDGVEIEDDVFVGPNVSFTNDLYPRSKAYLKEYPRTRIKQQASIGAGSVLIAGIVIGRCAMVGAGSVVTKNVGDHELGYGNPARRQGYICSCAQKMEFGRKKVVTCSCGAIYKLGKTGVRRI